MVLVFKLSGQNQPETNCSPDGNCNKLVVQGNANLIDWLIL